MAYERVGVAGLTDELKQTYLRQLLKRAVPNLVHGGWGLKGTIPRGGGRSVEWRRLETIGANTTPLTEGTPGAATQITFVNVQATVDQFGQYTQLTDLVSTQAFDPVVAELTEAFGETMGNTLDQVVRNILVAGTTLQHFGAKGSRGDISSGDHINYAELREAVDTLERNNAKRFGNGLYAGIMHPDTKRDFFADTDILTTLQNAGPRTGENALIRARVGEFYGVDWVETSNARIFASEGRSGADVYATLVFGEQWYGIVDYTDPMNGSAEVIVKPLGSAGTGDPLNQLSTVGWKAAIQAAILNQNFGVRMEHNTSRSESA
jgi:N4-gp56 family major capsid protein